MAFRAHFLKEYRHRRTALWSQLSQGKFRREPATSQFVWSFAPIPRFDERFACQYRYEPPSLFGETSPYPGIVHQLSGPNRCALARVHQQRWIGQCCNESLAFFTLISRHSLSLDHSHICQTPWSVLQDGTVPPRFTESPAGPSNAGAPLEPSSASTANHRLPFVPPRFILFPPSQSTALPLASLRPNVRSRLPEEPHHCLGIQSEAPIPPYRFLTLLSFQSSFLSFAVLVCYRFLAYIQPWKEGSSHSSCVTRQLYSSQISRQPYQQIRGFNPLWLPLSRSSPLFRLEVYLFSEHNSGPGGSDFHLELLPVHSQILRQSQLISFPPLSDMLKFSGCSCLSQAHLVFSS
eukprot:TRINITY_DN984_c0_g1_i10.p1 TRINITY_DN984_c0_g1~~TRINITY_DN984_c0_g1_i10.p1  ORF type:complete len:349 (+),score=-62.70 TRINITY_DN984_c0_g1_i10:575-1621(+)